VDIEGISIFHLDSGKIRHPTTIWDGLGLMHQIGAITTLG
jgi:hypothetical protein